MRHKIHFNTLRKYFFLLILLCPLFSYSQTYKSYGLKFGYSLHENGWNSPDTLGYAYHNKVYIYTAYAGAYGEFFGKKYFNTMVDAALRVRQFFFQFDRASGTQASNERTDSWYFTLAVSEKLKYDYRNWSFYVYAGLKGDVRIHNGVANDFQDVFNNSKSFIFGATSGIGFAKGISKFWRISFDIYYEPDISNTYSSTHGILRTNEIGFKVGFGPFNPANK